jgi:hypothetical protein
MFSIYKEVWKIVKHSIRFTQIFAFSISAFVGVSVLLFAVFAYVNFLEVKTRDSGIFSDEFVIISKKVSIVQTVSQRPAHFSDRELRAISQQEFFTDVAPFQSSRFHTQLYTNNPNMPLRTDLFFESVPDTYIKHNSEVWNWQIGDNFIPIIVPHNFLSLYNFGFAPSQGLPQLSEDIIKTISFQVRISGNGAQQEFTARVVDFTNRINSVLVPESFLSWANQQYGYKDAGNPSRLILATQNSADARIFQYIAQQNYQINDDSLTNSKLSFYLKLTLSIVGTIGIIITVLAMWLLIFNFHLIIEKNKVKIRNLWYLGYSFSSLLLPYHIISIAVNSIIMVFAFCSVFFVNKEIISFMQQFVQFNNISPVIPLMCALLLLAILIGINYVSIRRVLRQAIQ